MFKKPLTVIGYFVATAAVAWLSTQFNWIGYTCAALWGMFAIHQVIEDAVSLAFLKERIDRRKQAEDLEVIERKVSAIWATILEAQQKR